MKDSIKGIKIIFFLSFICIFYSNCSVEQKKIPNILLFITDDQSWVHTSMAGEDAISTPGFDRVAKEGIYFENAFCAAPSCSPSRGAIITGQEMWRLGEAAQLFSAVPHELKQLSFPLILEEHGFHIAYTQKGWAPNDFKKYNWDKYPLGEQYNKFELNPPADGIENNDYAANFDDFLNSNESNKPFFFWFGSTEPHRRYEIGSGKENGIDLTKIKVPGFLPDVDIVRSDIADYLLEVQWVDRQLVKMISNLEDRGILENTIIIVTSDNGMPFPGAKTTLNEYGTRVPLAIRWGDGIKDQGTINNSLISLTDLAPTILSTAGIKIPDAMTGKDLSQLFEGKPFNREYVFVGKERHTVCRPDDLPHPQRSARDHQFLYIKNSHPDRWPAGDPEVPATHGPVYGDIDASTTKSYMMDHKDDEEIKPLFDLAMGKHPAEELYDIVNDPYCLHNLVDNIDYDNDKKRLATALKDYQLATNDPRADETTSYWDSFPFYLRNPTGITPHRKALNL